MRSPDTLLKCFTGLAPGIILLGALGGICCGGGRATPTAAGSQGRPLDPAPYLLVEQGNLPVVLSAPHGGTLTPPGVPERTQGTTVLDIQTLELAQAIQARLQALTGGKAHLVAARVSRNYVDFNRVPAEAYESTAVAPLYQAYHGALRSAVDAVRPSRKALLIDLHGQSQDVLIVYRGTRDGLTADLPLLCGSGGFLGELGAQGLALQPALANQAESPNYNGGHIVATYGKGNSDGIDAVQLEFGITLRANPDALNATAEKVATALEAFLRQR